MIEKILNYKIIELSNFSITTEVIIKIIFIFIITKILLWIITRTLLRVKKVRNERKEDIYIINKIISYVIWLFSILFILNTLGVKITALLTGSAALLVGIGLGLQQTFNDFISGVILLFEGKTMVGDVLEVEGRLMTLTNIGLRTTEGIDRDGIAIIIPNSKIVTDKVINWSHQEDKKVRFNIEVGVAYGSNVDLVIKLLEESAQEHPQVTNKDLIEARLINFGDSSLDFKLFFFSKTIFRIGKIESDIRRTINKKFNDHHITIPFPQMDVQIKQNQSTIN